MTEFRNRGLSVVVDTTHFAELDFEDNSISQSVQERVARDLKHVLISQSDRIEGYFRIREVVEDWHVIFTHYTDKSNYVVLIVGYVEKGELESSLRLLARAGLEQFAPGAKVLIKGRKAK